MTVDSDSDRDLEAQIAQWRAFLEHRHAGVDELEIRLRSTVADLTAAGLQPDEAFLVAVKRMGGVDGLSREFAEAQSGRLWKQLVLGAAPDAPAPAGPSRDLLVMVACAAAGAIGVKVPALFGHDFGDDGFYLLNIGLFALAPLAAYLAVRRRLGAAGIGVLLILFAIGGVGANIYPLTQDSQSLTLTAIHLPVALWLVVGFAYAGGDWRSDVKRMDFVRFSGEWFIYFVLIALGGGVLIGVTLGVFDAIGVDVDHLVQYWLLPCGAMAAVVVAGWLVETRTGVIENMAPVLTRLFTPLFTVTLLGFLGAVLAAGRIINVQRNVLIMFDVVLAVVLGLLLYAISARERGRGPGVFDWLQLALAVSASLIDILVLLAVTGRMTEWGTTANKTAALGENVILFVNLAWTAVLLAGFVRRRRPYELVERWQTRYLGVYAAWAWAVVLAFPPAFDFM